MAKKILSLVLVIALTASIAIAGTVAYLTSTDEDVNVMTLGLAKIDQFEKQRVDMNHQDQQTPAELEDFEQGQPLYPAVNTNGGAANDPAVWQPGEATNEAYVNYGTLVDADITGPHWTGVWDKSLKNVMDKMVFVKNTGTVDVYYRTIILYEYDETKTVNSYDQKMIHFNINSNTRFDWTYPEYTVEVDGEVYGVMVATYNKPLLPGTVSRPSLLQVGLDGDATNEVVAQFGETYDMLVLSQAVQTTGFGSAEAALTAGFGEINEANLKKWFTGMEAPAWYGDTDTTWYNDTNVEFTLSTAEEVAGLAELVNGGNSFYGKTIKLGADINLNGYEWTPIGQTDGYYAQAYFQGDFDGQEHTISGLTIEATNDGTYYAAGFFGFLDCGQSGTIKNVTFDKATVNGHHWTGVAAGYLSGNMENVTVTNSTVTCTHANDDACGDKAGAVVGYINGTQGKMTECTASGCTVTAGRDAGQVVGCAASSQVVNCTATNVTVTAAGDCTGANIRNEVIGRVN